MAKKTDEGSMGKLRFLFFKAGRDGKVLDNGISIWSAILAVVRFDFKSLPYNYSHVELENVAAQMCFSATTRGEWKGVRLAPSSEVLKHPERWDYIEVEVPQDSIDRYFEWAKTQVGRPYDYWGIFGFFWFWNTQDGRKDYCSELIAAAAYSLLVLYVLYKRVSPRRLARILAKKYHKPKPLKP